MSKTRPKPAKITEKDLLDKTLGCMKGKAIGGTLGTPVEGHMTLLNLTFYDPVPTGILPNDDLDLQLSALECVEAHGGLVHHNLLARMWREQVHFPWDEYGCGKANLERGLLPPVSGWYDNPFEHCMGSPIRSEMWAMLAPGRPALAAHFAYHDACVDHGLEGIAGEMFYAALESAAMVTPANEINWRQLIGIGLTYTPKHSRVYKALAFTLKEFPKHPDFKTLRQAILDGHGHPNFTDAPQNLAFSILGLLYHPEDFTKALLLTTNCGYDTDCTAATIGAIWGAAKGDHFPEHWLTPIGNALTASHPVVDMGLEADLVGLCKRVRRMSPVVLNRYKKLNEASVVKIMAEDMAHPNRVTLGDDFSVRVNLTKGPVLNHPGTLAVDVKGAVKAAHIREPFQVKKTGSKVTVKSGAATGYTPRRVGVVLEGNKGGLFHLDMVTAHELFIAERRDGDRFADLAKVDIQTDPAFKPFVMLDRSLDLRKTGEGPWIQLTGFVHLGDFLKYRFFPSAECAVQGFIDGVPLVKVDKALPNIPAPHRCQNPVQFADVELKAGWHRIDVFLNREKTIREGGFTLVLAEAYTKQLVTFKFHRSMGGVYAHGLPKIG